jgi:tetratricopeptide (TPR) repeat protein
VALGLLERYFALEDRFDDAQAHVDRATALVALGSIDEAIAAYEDALRREKEFPNLKTQAYIALPYLIAVRSIGRWFDRALAVLEEHRARLTFPVDHFQWHAALALIAAARGDFLKARDHANQALEAASRDKSGFRYHPDVGLVSDEHSATLQKLRQFCDA